MKIVKRYFKSSEVTFYPTFRVLTVFVMLSGLTSFLFPKCPDSETKSINPRKPVNQMF